MVISRQFVLVAIFSLSSAFRKVIVPAVYKEWVHGAPDWAVNETLMATHNYEVFLYQKHNASDPNYIEFNRGLEAGVYLRYIVDHYDDFPDVAMFVHARPEDHQPHFLQWLNCVSPNVTYISINNVFIGFRSISAWPPDTRIWIEQCYRDVLRIIWGLENDTSKFNELVPVSKEISMSTMCCHQFVLGRTKVHERPKEVWQKLLKIIGEQNACHMGNPDYDNLFFYHKYHKKVGQEPEILVKNPKNPERPGGKTQVNAMEHLADLIYGGYHNLHRPKPNQTDYCNNFLDSCPHSPCKEEIPRIQDVRRLRR